MSICSVIDTGTSSRSNRSSNHHHLSKSWKEPPSLSCSIATNKIDSWWTYCNVYERICMYTSVPNRSLMSWCSDKIEIQFGILPEHFYQYAILRSSKNTKRGVIWNTPNDCNKAILILFILNITFVLDKRNRFIKFMKYGDIHVVFEITLKLHGPLFFGFYSIK